MAPPWELRRRGLKDSLRHDQRVKEAIRKNLRELIAEEEAAKVHTYRARRQSQAIDWWRQASPGGGNGAFFRLGVNRL